MTEYLDKPPFVAPSEPSGPCDWLESCWLPSTDWRRDPETKGFVPVCAQHSLEAREQALLARVAELESEVVALTDERNDLRHELAELREALGEELGHMEAALQENEERYQDERNAIDGVRRGG